MSYKPEKREILFKAKRIDNGEWVEGLLTVMWGQYHMINPKDENIAFSIELDTICQYTGLADKNGVKIWENDIVKYEDAECDAEGYHDNVFVNIGKVFISPYGGVIFTNRQTVDMDDLYDTETSIDAEVIGNIFDNPELLEREG